MRTKIYVAANKPVDAAKTIAVFKECDLGKTSYSDLQKIIVTDPVIGSDETLRKIHFKPFLEELVKKATDNGLATILRGNMKIPASFLESAQQNFRRRRWISLMPNSSYL